MCYEGFKAEEEEARSKSTKKAVERLNSSQSRQIQKKLWGSRTRLSMTYEKETETCDETH